MRLFDRAVAGIRFHHEAGELGGLSPRVMGTGALINNTAGDRAPFLLTARHHFLFGKSWVRLGPYPSFEAVWDYTEAAIADSQAESLSHLPRSRGAVLLACDAVSDFALLRLQSIPAGRTFLGWQAAAVEGYEFHRLSHPYGYPQTYTCHRGLEIVAAGKGLVSLFGARHCADPPYILYKTRFEGTLGPGSSGAPLLTADLRLVGQLWGVSEVHGIAYALDGAFPHTYSQVRQWLDPLGRGEAPALCSEYC